MSVYVARDLFLVKGLIGKAAPLVCLAGIQFDQQIAGNPDLAPAAGVQKCVELFGNGTFIPAGLPQIVQRDGQLLQAVLKLLSFLWKCLA